MSFMDSVKKFFSGVKDTTTSIADTAKVRMDISKEKDALKDKFLELGQLTYEEAKSGRITDERAVTLADEIDALQKSIEEKTAIFSEKKEQLVEGGKAAASGVASKVVDVATDAKDAVVSKVGEMKQKAAEKKSQAEAKVEEVKEDVEEAIDEAKEQAQDKVEEVKEEVVQKAEEVKENLEG